MEKELVVENNKSYFNTMELLKKEIKNNLEDYNFDKEFYLFSGKLVMVYKSSKEQFKLRITFPGPSTENDGFKMTVWNQTKHRDDVYKLKNRYDFEAYQTEEIIHQLLIIKKEIKLKEIF